MPNWCVHEDSVEERRAQVVVVRQAAAGRNNALTNKTQYEGQ